MMEPLIGVFASSCAAATTGTAISPASATSVGVRMLRPLVVHDQRVHRVGLEFLTTAQEGQLDHEGDADHLAAELPDQAQRGGHGAAGGEQVVDRQHALAGLD